MTASKPDFTWLLDLIDEKDLLFFYDEPLLWVHRVDGETYLCEVVDGGETPTECWRLLKVFKLSELSLNRLRSNQLHLRQSTFMTETVWLVRSTTGKLAGNAWKIADATGYNSEDVPERYLAKPRVFLYLSGATSCRLPHSTEPKET